MRDINKIIQELYGAYVKKDIALMKILLDEWKAIDANNSYLKKYESLYHTLDSTHTESLSQNTVSEEKIVQFWWKTIKCPHCGSNLSMSENNKKVIADYKAGITKVLNFQCKYCMTQFIWNNVWMKPLYLNISVWQEITLDNKKYRVAGWVRYMWTWETQNTGRLEYIERILIDSSWDTYYLSESKAWWNEWWESWIEYQTELSRKIVPEFNLWELTESNIVINNNNYNIEEICEVKVTEVYGENSKSYTIWESVKTYQLKYSGKSYVFEKEQTKNQQEIWVYHIWEVNDKNLRSGNIGYSQNYWNIPNFTLLKWIYIILLFIIPFSFFSCERTIKEVTLADITDKNLQEVQWLYKVNFSGIYKKDLSESLASYDYWGKKHIFQTLDGIKFKLESQNDLDILKKILSWDINIASAKVKNNDIYFTNVWEHGSWIPSNSFSSYFTWNTILQFK